MTDHAAAPAMPADASDGPSTSPMPGAAGDTTEVSQVGYGIDFYGRIWEVADGAVRRLAADPKHPLASRDGMKLLGIWLELDRKWRELTTAQQRCLLDPETRTARPWDALRAKGYADDDGLTPEGRFLAIHQRTKYSKAVAS